MVNGVGRPITEIPPGEIDYVFRLLTPDKYYGRSVNDWITPLIAEVVITHENHPDTRLLVRWGGKNPAMISVDGRNYFYGRQYEDIFDGGTQLVRVLDELAAAKPH